jgi:hypothetical protein
VQTQMHHMRSVTMDSHIAAVSEQTADSIYLDLKQPQPPGFGPFGRRCPEPTERCLTPRTKRDALVAAVFSTFLPVIGRFL